MLRAFRPHQLRLAHAVRRAPTSWRPPRASWRPPRARTFSDGEGGSAIVKYVRSRCHYIVHFGNFVVLVSINQTDMLNLRCLALVSTSCSIAFNLLQPTPLITPACWGAFFIACHLYQLSVLLRERQETTLSRREELAYEQAFLRYGFTPRQFVDIVERSSGRWPTFARGEYVHRSGEAMDEIHCLLDGAVEQVSTTGEAFATLHAGKGGWLGEFFDPNQDASYWERPHRFPISYRCVSEGGCATLALARRALHETITTNPRLHAAATRAEVADLWGKIHQDMPELRQPPGCHRLRRLQPSLVHLRRCPRGEE